MSNDLVTGTNHEGGLSMRRRDGARITTLAGFAQAEMLLDCDHENAREALKIQLCTAQNMGQFFLHGCFCLVVYL